MQIMQKKIISILLVLAIISAFIPNLISNAETEPSFTLSVSGATEVTAEEGDYISVDIVYANGYENQWNLGALITFDPEMLEAQADGYSSSSNYYYWDTSGCMTTEVADLCSAVMDATNNGGQDGEITITCGPSVAGYINTSGTLGTIQFKVLKGGTTTISVSYAATDSGDQGIITTEITNTTDVTITSPIKATGVTITDYQETIKVGETSQFVATKTPTDASDNITWSTSDSSVATVDESGNVTGIKSGTVTITATCGNYTDTKTVTVTNPMTALTLSSSSEKLDLSEIVASKTVTLTATPTPADADDISEITWESSDTSVATVSNGIVTAVGQGTATITAKCGNFSQECTITVVESITSISLSETSLDIDKGNTETLTVTVEPTDTTDTYSVEWSSSDTSIATVDENGLVTAVERGTATITATVTTSSGKTYTETCTVNVKVHLESIEITEGDITLYKGQSQDLTVTYSPDEFEESKTITWSTSDQDIVTVENGTVTAIKPGTATITATASNGVTSTITVTVPEINIETLYLNKTSTSIEKGSTETLTATIAPDNTTDDKTITWESSDTSVATVDENGVVTAVAPGTAIITATSSNSLTATCTVTVTCALEEITLSSSDETLVIGENETVTLVASKNPEDADPSLDNLVWSSSDTSIATVDEYGVVTAVAPGTTIIKATLEGKEAYATITVEAALTGVKIENSDTTLELVLGQTGSLNVNYTPSNATIIPTATWTSSDTSVVTVDENGNLTTVGEGTATITVDYGDGITDTRKVKVTATHTDSITIMQNVESLIKGETVQLTAEVNPTDSVDTISWSSSDTSIATVDENGLVTAVKPGTVKITVTSSNGIEIEVKEVNVESVSLSVSNDDTEVEEGSTKQVSLTINPSNTTDTLVITYTSSDESVALVDSTTGVVTAKKAGDVIINVSVVATSDDGTTNTYTSQIALTVTEKTESNPATGTTTGTTEENVSGTTTDTTDTTGSTDATTSTTEESSTSGESTTSESSSSETTSTVASAVETLTTSPHTGDMNIEMLIALMFISLVGMVIVIKKL